MSTIYEGDVYIFDTPDGGAISIQNGQPIIDQGLESCVYISHFTEDNWQNDLDRENPERQNHSRFEEIFNKNINNTTRLEAIEFSKDAMQWMLDIGLADEIEVDASIITPTIMLVEISIKEPGKENPQIFKYAVNWEKQEFTPAYEYEKSLC